jgi:hypothetical protein
MGQKRGDIPSSEFEQRKREITEYAIALLQNKRIKSQKFCNVVQHYKLDLTHIYSVSPVS